MKWLFIDTTILTEQETGFTIRLNAGTWEFPMDITPDHSTISFQEQARLIKLGLKYAKEASMTESLSHVS